MCTLVQVKTEIGIEFKLCFLSIHNNKIGLEDRFYNKLIPNSDI